MPNLFGIPKQGPAEKTPSSSLNPKPPAQATKNSMQYTEIFVIEQGMQLHKNHDIPRLIAHENTEKPQSMHLSTEAG